MFKCAKRRKENIASIDHLCSKEIGTLLDQQSARGREIDRKRKREREREERERGKRDRDRDREREEREIEIDR